MSGLRVIVLSPAKTMADVRGMTYRRYDRAGGFVLPPETEAIYRAVSDLDSERAGAVFGCPEAVAADALSLFRRMKLSGGYPAIDVYSGLAFRQLDGPGLSPVSRAFAGRHLRILSALYGTVPALMPIEPYRLDMQARLTVDGQSLKRVWRAGFNRMLADAGVTEILNLASGEFGSLIDRSRFQVTEVDFVRLRAGRLLRQSALSKKGRGRLARFLIENGDLSDEAIRRFGSFRDSGFDLDETAGDAGGFCFVER